MENNASYCKAKCAMQCDSGNKFRTNVLIASSLLLFCVFYVTDDLEMGAVEHLHLQVIIIEMIIIEDFSSNAHVML